MISKLLSAVKSEGMFFAMVFGAVSFFHTAAYGMYHIPSESMLPTLVVGDRIAVNKFAYGYSRHSLPFSLGKIFPKSTGRLLETTPVRGDVVVFKHPRTGETYIKRVIGIAGDTISISEGRVRVNNVIAERIPLENLAYKERRGGVASVTRFEEQASSGKSYFVFERDHHRRGDTMDIVTVPPGMLFVMGDNRDNSLDSRFFKRGVGFVPMENLVGRAEITTFSLYRCARREGLQCHTPKWFAPVR